MCSFFSEMRTYKTFIVIALVFACLTLLFAILAIPRLCYVVLGDTTYKCSGSLYDNIDEAFKSKEDNNVKFRVMFIFHVFALAGAVATIILAGVALGTKLRRNFVFMIVTLVIAAATSFNLLVVAAVWTEIYVTWLKKEFVDELVEFEANYRGGYVSQTVQVAMLWSAFICCTAVLICLILALVTLPTGSKKKRGKKGGKKKRGKKGRKKRRR